MGRHLILSPDAEADVKSANRWYQEIEKSLSVRFKAEVGTALSRIASNPLQFPLVNGWIRRVLLNRFPYSIYFALNKDMVFVIAVIINGEQIVFGPAE